MTQRRNLPLVSALLAVLLAQPAFAQQQPLSAEGIGIGGFVWACDLDGAPVGTLVTKGTSYDIADVSGAAIGSGAYRKGFDAVTVLDGPLVDLYGIKTGVYGTKAAEEMMIFYGTEKRKLTCRGTAD